MKPEFMIARAGDTVVEFICSLTKVVEWKFNDAPLPSNAEGIQRGTTYLLRINNLKKKNAGAYTCSIERDLLIYRNYAVLEVHGSG